MNKRENVVVQFNHAIKTASNTFCDINFRFPNVTDRISD